MSAEYIIMCLSFHVCRSQQIHEQPEIPDSKCDMSTLKVQVMFHTCALLAGFMY